jgi:hypothetical protein
MDEPLEIPHEAKAAAYKAAVGIPTTFGLINTAIDAAAPLIVAAELRRLLTKLSDHRFSYAVILKAILDRATELEQ